MAVTVTSSQIPITTLQQIESTSPNNIAFTTRNDLDPIEESVLKLEYDINQTIKNNNDKLVEENDKIIPKNIDDIDSELLHISRIPNQNILETPKLKNVAEDYIIEELTTTMKAEPNFKKMLYALTTSHDYPRVFENFPLITSPAVLTSTLSEDLTETTLKITYSNIDDIPYKNLNFLTTEIIPIEKVKLELILKSILFISYNYN